MVTEIVDLDLSSNSSFKIITMQGDIASRFIEFHLTYNNETFDLTGKTVLCRYLNDDKTVITTNLVINDKTNGICTLDIPYTLMKNPYVTRSELVIKQSNEILSTIPFTVEVVKSLVKSSVIESSDEFGALNEALWKVEGFKSEIEKITNYIFLKDYQDLVIGEDWSNALETAIKESINNNIPLFIHNGEYGLSKTITPSTDINSDIAYKILTIIGENPNGVIFKGINSFNGRAFDFRYMRNLYLENFTSKLQYHFIQYGADENKIQSKRNIVIKNVFCNASGEQINWNNYICTPRPNSYSDNNGGDYSRYPLEIMNFSGYNAVMIVNKSVDEEGNIINGGVDNSALGITDKVKGTSSPSILVDGGLRSFLQLKNSNAETKSAERQDVVYEINQNGNIAIGCSTQSSDTVASGSALIKARGKYPIINMYDQNRSNRKFSFYMADDVTYINNYDESGTVINRISMNYKTGVISFKGTLQLGSVLTWSDTNATKSANGITSIYVPSSITSRFEHITDGVEGQTIHIISDGTLTVEHYKDSWGNIRTNTKANVILEKGVLYTLTRINNLWYLK